MADYVTPEELRILNAAKDGRIYFNSHGRWVIWHEERPNRKARESLVARKFMAFERDSLAYSRGRYVLTERGSEALNAAIARRTPALTGGET